MNINQIKPIRQLPELEDHQEWVCEHGCDHIEPKLYRHVYSESWDREGIKLHELAEHYYTCQHGHVLQVWNEEFSDYATLPDEAYQERPVPEGLTLPYIEKLVAELQSEKTRIINNMDSETQKLFKFSKISFELTFKSGEVLGVDEHCLNEIKAQMIEDAELNAVCDARKDQKKISVNIEDL